MSILINLPLPIPDELWQDLNMDFVLGLEKTFMGFDSILVVFDRFSKMWEIIPCMKIMDAVYIAKVFLGLLKTIVSDRNVKFMIYFWKTLRRLLQTKLNFSSAFDPQMDRKNEIINQSLGDLLWCLVGDNVINWDQILWLNFLVTIMSMELLGIVL